MASKPNVSIITPTTHARARFTPMLRQNVLSQTYPHANLEWIVVGDMDKRTRDLYSIIFAQMPTIACKYYECDIDDSIGRKRNFACKKASFKILASVDDDDYYQKTYVEHAVGMLRDKKVNMVACRDMIVFFPLAAGKMTIVRGNLVHEGTVVCTKNHWKAHKYHPTQTGEGAGIARGAFWNELDIKKVMICFAHDGNTFKKDALQNATEVRIPESLRQQLFNLWSVCA